MTNEQRRRVRHIEHSPPAGALNPEGSEGTRTLPVRHSMKQGVAGTANPTRQ